ncbi:transmembrane protein 254 [Amia ocellicauda]|uniref:transmembrane protein 254 n=1 Tax=Amia ocellicauda TaxID=2972642 RepID=UPI003463FA78
MARVDGGTYFSRTSLFWMVAVTLSMGYYTWVVFWPQQVPYEKLGPVGTFSKYMADNQYPLIYYGWWVALAIHVAEALYSLKVCSDKGIDSVVARFLWCFQTFLFGYFSLSLLLKYKPDPRPKRH